ncbi:MAG: endogenous inhibitor of DNA gyrase (YacG/DUF329 family) [Candidatus Latescibacterota bacterium]|jgi:endogenous inhibitor of DNA gyrase (YacG/DUF329 family)
MEGWVTLFVIVALLSFVLWMACAIATAAIAHKRGDNAYIWMAFGVMLGPVGLLLVLKILAQECPHCQAPVLRAVFRCPGCGKEVPHLKENPMGPFWTYRRHW